MVKKITVKTGRRKASVSRFTAKKSASKSSSKSAKSGTRKKLSKK